MVKNGVKTVGFIGFNDPYGENWYDGVQRAGAEGRHQDRRQRAFPAHRLVGDRSGREADGGQARRGARRRGRRPDRAAADDAVRRRLQGPHLPDARRGVARFPAPRRRQGRGHRARREPHARAARDSGQRSVEGRRASSTSTRTTRCTAASRRRSAPTSTMPGCCSSAPCPKPRSAASPARRSSAPRCATRSRPRASSSARRASTTCPPEDHSGFDERGRVLIIVKDGNWRLLKD